MKKLINATSGIYHDLKLSDRGGYVTRCSAGRFGGVAWHEYANGRLDGLRLLLGYPRRGLSVGLPDGRYRRCKACARALN